MTNKQFDQHGIRKTTKMKASHNRMKENVQRLHIPKKPKFQMEEFYPIM